MKDLLRGVVIAILLVTVMGINDSHADQMTSFAELLAGDSIVDGDLTYSNFELSADIGTVSPNFTDIWIRGTGNGLEFSSPNEFFLFPGSDSLILEFGYEVEATDPQSLPRFNRIGTDFGDNSAFVPGFGLVDLFVDYSTTQGDFVGDANSVVDPLFGAFQPLDQKLIPDVQANLKVNTSLTIFADSNSLVALRRFEVISAIPEPASAAVLGTLVLAGLFVRRRK